MSTNLVQVTVVLSQGAAIASPTGAAYQNTSVVVTDSTGTAQPAVTLNGSETPAWTFTTSVAPGAGTVVATDLDVSGAVLNTVSQPFTEAGTPVTFTPTSGITVTPTAAAAAAAVAKAAARK
jgi:hypothetical protein